MGTKIRFYYVLIPLLLVLLTGCVRGNVDITLNKDGSADLAYKLDIAKTATAFLGDAGTLEQMKTKSEQAGYKTSITDDQDYAGIQGSKHLSSINQLTIELNSLAGTSIQTTSEQLVKSGNWFYDIYTLNTHIDLSSANLANKIPIALNEQSKEFLTSLVAKNMDLKLNVTLPVQASMSNANRVLYNQASTYQWDLIPGQNNQIRLQVKILNIPHLILLASAAVALGLLLFIIRKWNARRAK
ncbi:hypothetical protein PP175_18940 [Aneurinibacillus sp. Ricciae_BoGa-3]|uniref:hypothetical protein n=1 Tax=Aneurinibacillus sp. Ricciae_BoGa-3 TaxID=3022697 RepID=UPI00234083A6|nr:hypothetical protein [Aneurinibacillus sp. Ricciae_BoGa-3]WCK53406.1 hypothetical protein PP175_18940 [Aneurinibacillus sp. Ricciae_BoGa-3]